MFYAIRHVTRFTYSVPISESMMEVRMQPRTEGPQHCLNFRLQTNPRAQIFAYRDALGNTVHHFDVPGRHGRLTVTAETLVELGPTPPLPEALPAGAWEELDALAAGGEHWFKLMPSHFAHPTPALADLAAELDIRRRADPLTVAREATAAIARTFAYVPSSTTVDSLIDEALENRAGVCQDFAHILITLLRGLGIPSRYVSGYLVHLRPDQDRSAADATHAWVEALLPGLGWVGFDPTNDLIAAERHIRTAVGRDYADVPPTRGVYKGKAESQLEVAVRVTPTEAPPTEDEFMPAITWLPPERDEGEQAQMEQQQQ